MASIEVEIKAYEWAETVVDALNDFASHQLDEVLAAAREAGTDEQREALAEYEGRPSQAATMRDAYLSRSVSLRGSVSSSRRQALVHANTAEEPPPPQTLDSNGHFSNESGHSDSRWHPARG